jgi:hypothetical protein
MRWNTRLIVIVLSATLCPVLATAERQTTKGLMINITDVSRNGVLKVELVNESRKPLRVWKDSNSWGWARWRLLIVRQKAVLTFFQNPDQDFTINNPTFEQLAPGSSVVKRLDLNDGSWRGTVSGPIELQASDLIIALYDVPFTPESLRLDVWYGVSSSFFTVN